MLHHRRPLLPLAVASVVLMSLAATAQEGDFHNEKPLDIELAIAAEVLRVSPQDLRLLDRRVFTLPNTKVVGKALKVFNPKTGDTERVVLDESNKPVNHAALLAAEAEAHRKIYGNLSVRLHRLLEHRPNDVLPVLVRLDIPDEPLAAGGATGR